ncbi:hypothetical protein GCM10022221_44150 [Actinocorallia aurea]
MNEDASAEEAGGEAEAGHPTAEFGQVVAELRRLQEVFDAKIRYDEVRERHVEAMSEELARHRQDLHRSILRPVLLDLVTLYDDLFQVVEAADPAGPATDLAMFRDSVEQILERNGVQRFTVEGDAVDRARQRVLSRIDTTDEALDRKVAVRLRAGFADGDRVLRPEWVSAYRFTRVQSAVEPEADAPADASQEGAPR